MLVGKFFPEAPGSKIFPMSKMGHFGPMLGKLWPTFWALLLFCRHATGKMQHAGFSVMYLGSGMSAPGTSSKHEDVTAADIPDPWHMTENPACCILPVACLQKSAKAQNVGDIFPSMGPKCPILDMGKMLQAGASGKHFPTRKNPFPQEPKVAFWGGTRGTACERVITDPAKSPN